jgi:hypothetical protein
MQRYIVLYFEIMISTVWYERTWLPVHQIFGDSKVILHKIFVKQKLTTQTTLGFPLQWASLISNGSDDTFDKL